MDAEVALYKRWLLRPGVQVDDVIRLIRTQVVPSYRNLSPHVTLELHVVEETMVLAVQRWTSRAELDAALAPDRFDD